MGKATLQEAMHFRNMSEVTEMQGWFARLLLQVGCELNMPVHPGAPEEDFKCNERGAMFATRRQVSAHVTFKHRQRVEANGFIHDTTCQWCLKKFASTHRLLRHLLGQKLSDSEMPLIWNREPYKGVLLKSCNINMRMISCIRTVICSFAMTIAKSFIMSLKGAAQASVQESVQGASRSLNHSFEPHNKYEKELSLH